MHLLRSIHKMTCLFHKKDFKLIKKYELKHELAKATFCVTDCVLLPIKYKVVSNNIQV